jgi:hypothetical protein
VTILGLSTLLLGGAYAAVGGWVIFAGADMLVHPSNDPWIQLATFYGIVPALLIVVGLAVLGLAILGLLAGLGVLLRKQWGRVLTFTVAVLALLLGLLWVVGSDGDTTDIAIGAVQILYGIPAFVILIVNGAEFSRPRVMLCGVSDGHRAALFVERNQT